MLLNKAGWSTWWKALWQYDKVFIEPISHTFLHLLILHTISLCHYASLVNHSVLIVSRSQPYHCYVVVIQIFKRQKVRRIAVFPYQWSKGKCWHTPLFFCQFRRDANKFFLNYFCMSLATFDELYNNTLQDGILCQYRKILMSVSN